MFTWYCPLCSDRMQSADDPRQVEHDRNEHLRRNHAGATIEAHHLVVGHSPCRRPDQTWLRA